MYRMRNVWRRQRRVRRSDGHWWGLAARSHGRGRPPAGARAALRRVLRAPPLRPRAFFASGREREGRGEREEGERSVWKLKRKLADIFG